MRGRTAAKPAIVFSLAILLVSPAAAQDEPGLKATSGRFSCRGAVDSSSLSSPYRGMSLDRLQRRPTDLPPNARRIPFGPFDESHYAFKNVDFYEYLVDMAPHEENVASLSTTTQVHIYVRTTGKRGEQWFALKSKDVEQMYADDPAQTSDRGQELKSTHPPAAIYQPDPALPLFQVSWGARWIGANASGTHDQLALFDLRGEPRLANHLECTYGEGGGVCTASDSGGAPDSLSCTWDRKMVDYACHATRTESPGWGERAYESDFYFLSGKDAYVAPEGTLADLLGFVQTLWSGAEPGQHALIPDMGEAQVIYEAREASRHLLLLAARGTGEKLDAQFFLAELPFANKSASVTQIRPAAAATLPRAGYGELDLRRRSIVPPGPAVSIRAIGVSPSFHVRRIWGNAGLTVLAVTVKEGAWHSLYWIGIDEQEQATVADSLLVASEARIYDHCNVYRVESSAASARVLPGLAFHAVLDLEPSRMENDSDLQMDEESPAEPACQRDLGWDHAKGFVFGEIGTCRTQPPRDVTISDEGVLEARPLAAKSPETQKK